MSDSCTLAPHHHPTKPTLSSLPTTLALFIHPLHPPIALQITLVSKGIEVTSRKSGLRDVVELLRNDFTLDPFSSVVRSRTTQITSIMEVDGSKGQ